MEKAAQQGNPFAQHNLALMYATGQGVRQDFHKAKEWYEKAAEQNAPYSQFNLALLYQEGKGVRQDFQQAKE